MSQPGALRLLLLAWLLGACGTGAVDATDSPDSGDDAEGSDIGTFCDGGSLCDGVCVETASDDANCGDCGAVCAPFGDHDVAACIDSQCVRSCEDRWFDHDGDQDCETFCVPTNQGIEACDAIDNDCDGHVDTDDESFANLVCGEQRGVCEGAVATCLNGVSACDYRSHAGTRRYQPTETRCDGRDNDCDGQSDETCCMPATIPQLDDAPHSLGVAGLEVLVLGVAHADAQAHVLLRAQRVDDELGPQTIWRAETAQASTSYHPVTLSSQLVDAPTHGDGVFRDQGWDFWYLEDGNVFFARLLPESAEAVDGAAVELDGLPAPLFAIRAFALDGQRTAIYLANNDVARIYVVEADQAVSDAYTIERGGSSVLGVWRSDGETLALEALEVDDRVVVRVVNLTSPDDAPLASIDGVPLTVPFVEVDAGGLVGAVHTDGLSRALRVGPGATLEAGEPHNADPWQCIATWQSDEGDLQHARYVESDGSGALELAGEDGPLAAGWVGDRLCPLTARASDDLTTVAVGLIGDRLPRRVALISVAPGGEYYCAEHD